MKRAGAGTREALDDSGPLSPDQLARNLDDLARIKRWLGHGAALQRWLAEASRRASSPLTVLDAGTGGADVPATLAWRAAVAGPELRVVGIDLHPQVAAEAGRRTQALGRVAIARADALRLPLADASVDVAICSYTLHHFERPQAQALLCELWRVARQGLVVVDLLRSRAGYWLAWLLLHLWGPGHRLSQRDGPLSLRRAYTLHEMRRLAAEAGLPQPLVARRGLVEGAILAPGDAFTGGRS